MLAVVYKVRQFMNVFFFIDLLFFKVVAFIGKSSYFGLQWEFVDWEIELGQTKQISN